MSDQTAFNGAAEVSETSPSDDGSRADTGSVIEIAGLHKRFDKSEVLKGVDFCVPCGSVVGLLGKNGSGKSTLIKCLLELLRPSDGTVRVFGEDPWDLSAESKSRLGYAAQEVSLYPWMRVR
jgi:ABC-2 type transport system ATP-binding protein